MDLKALLERSGLTVSGDPPEVTVDVVGESVPVMVQAGERDLVECVVALGDASAASEDADQIALDAPGDTTIERVDELVRITRRLSLPSQSELYDALHDVARCAIVLARAGGGVSGATFEKAVEPPAAPQPAPPPPAEPAPAPAPDPEATIATPVPVGDEPLFWFYVDTAQTIVSGDAARTVLATLEPGNWYRGLEEVGEWVRAADENGVEGWLGANVVRRQ